VSCIDGNGGMLSAAAWRRGRFTAGYARQLDGNGGMRVAAAWRRENGG